jgi:type II protein arginine methyltransferase
VAISGRDACDFCETIRPMIDRLSPAGAAAVARFLPALAGPARPGRLIDLAIVLEARGLRGDAARLCLQAIGEAPGDVEIAVRARQVLSLGVPRWHVPMLHDRPRAEAYDRAIRRAVRPGMLVLDIGTGSGLLAMMAARAGAALVVACEQHPTLALVAEQNIQRNGLADRIRVVASHSTTLTVGVELPRRADLVISEIVSLDLLREGIVDALEHARAHLLTADAVAIPAGGSIHVALGEGSLGVREPVATVAGFDVSAINGISAPSQVLSAHADVSVVSDSAELFSFDFSGRGRLATGRDERTLIASRAANVTGVVQWMTLVLDDVEALSTSADGNATHWDRAFFPAPGPTPVRDGDRVRVRGTHSRRSVAIWIPAPEPDPSTA